VKPQKINLRFLVYWLKPLTFILKGGKDEINQKDVFDAYRFPLSVPI